MQRGNLANTLPDASQGEVIERLAVFPGRRVAVERIVSEGQTTPPGAWYDQDWDEWVLVLKGAARIAFERPDAEEALAEGDWLLIPARRRHRVAFTAPGTLWLAVHGDTGEPSHA